jgi:hypothetical protein
MGMDVELEIVIATQCGVLGCGHINDAGPPMLALTDVNGHIEEVNVRVCTDHRQAMSLLAT